MSDERNNTGDRNTGDWNTGDRNTGDWNTGDCNTGDRNAGDRNTGDRNTGDRNTGDWNTGHWNTGDWNTGHWNTGDWNTGYFCVQEGPVHFFDQPVPGMTHEQARELIPYVFISPTGIEWVETSKMTNAEKESSPSHKTTGGYLRVNKRTIQECMAEKWPTITLEDRKRFLELPHFDADKFLKCAGVDVRLDRELFPQAEPVEVDEKYATVVMPDGKTYRLVPV